MVNTVEQEIIIELKSVLNEKIPSWKYVQIGTQDGRQLTMEKNVPAIRTNSLGLPNGSYFQAERKKYEKKPEKNVGTTETLDSLERKARSASNVSAKSNRLRRINLEPLDLKDIENTSSLPVVRQSNSWFFMIVMLLLGAVLIGSQQFWPSIINLFPTQKETINTVLQVTQKQEVEKETVAVVTTPTVSSINVSTPVSSSTAIAEEKYTIEKLKEEMQLLGDVQLVDISGTFPNVEKRLLLTYQGAIIAPKSSITEVFLLVQRGTVKELIPAHGQPITPRGVNETLEIFVMSKKAENKEEVYALQDQLVNAIKPQSRHEIKIERRLL